MFTRTSAPFPPPFLLRPGNRDATLPLLLNLLLCVLVSAVSGAEAGSAAKAASGPQTKARPEWTFTPDPALPNVLILGDSISVGYTLGVRARLAGRANVFRPLQADSSGPENCQGTTHGAKRIDHWLAGRKWDVIHFNWGLHDLKYVGGEGDAIAAVGAEGSRQQVPIDQYEANLAKLVERLKKTGAKLIWCATTPVPEGARGRVPGDEVRYNEAAARVMKEAGLPTDDLYAFALPKLDTIQNKADVHFTPQGSRQLAKTVGEAISALLPKR